MKIASWNVNSVKARLPHLLAFLEDAQPDVVCLQETKCLTADFPMLEAKALGYHVEAIGQRAYNGVALLSKLPPSEIVCGLPGDAEDEQPRYIEASFGEVRVASVYLPNGNPVDTDKFTYKLSWMERLVDHARELLRREIPFVLAGDYNICPTDDDVYDPVAFRDTRTAGSASRFRTLLYLGLTDAYRVFTANRTATPSGITRLGAGTGTRGCASITAAVAARGGRSWPATSTRSRVPRTVPRPHADLVRARGLA